jgi:hypothetical protein
VPVLEPARVAEELAAEDPEDAAGEVADRDAAILLAERAIA